MFLDEAKAGGVNEVNCISPDDEIKIMDFLRRKVYHQCATQKGKWFNARDLVGGENRDWRNTPLIELYWGNEENEEQAGKDLGWILKKLIRDEPSRVFDTKNDGWAREYLLVL